METNENSTAHHQVELMLPGIDKVWVRSPQGEWVDKKSLQKVFQPTETIEDENSIPHVKKAWWKFWRK